MPTSQARILVATIAMWACASLAHAVTDFSQEEWQYFEQLGVAAQKKQELATLQREAVVSPLTETEIISGIVDDYGLPTWKAAPQEQAGSLRVNLDGNDVIDERDILPLGYRNTDRSTSTTFPQGTGTDAPKVLVLMLKFTDQAPTNQTKDGNGDYTADGTHNVAWAEDHWFDLTAPADLADSSVSYYYQQASYDQFEFQGDVYNNSDFGGSVADANGWITSSYTRASITTTSDVYDAIEDALTQINANVDFSDYDSNADGFMDGLVVIYAGTSPGSPFWHMRWVGIHLEADNININSGIWSGEEAYLRTWCHEFGHELGLPDLYDVGYSPVMPGIGYWGIMGGWYTSMGLKPMLPSGWARMKLRFAEPVEIITQTSNQSYTLNRATASSSTDTLYRIWRNGHIGQEYFLVEFRDTNHGFDDSLRGSGGLVIWHIDEARNSAKNRDNSFDPQRVWVECAEHDGDPMDYDGNQAWRDGHNGDDAFDYFSDASTPNAHDNADAATDVYIEPTSDATSTTMTMLVANSSGTGLPTLTWVSPAEDATVSGSVTMAVTSNATDRVDFYVEGCLKHSDSTSPYSFSWDTETALDAVSELRAEALNSSGTDPVRVLTRSVTVSNGAGAGKAIPWTDDFGSYSAGSGDNTLLGLWNLHEDRAGMDIRILNQDETGWNTNAIVLAQTSFPDPGNGSSDDPNAGVYQGEDDEWLMSPRIALAGYNNLTLDFDVCFRASLWAEAILFVQVTNDDGASWDTLDGLTYYRPSSSDDYTGWWRDTAGQTHYWDSRSISLDSYFADDIYVRLLFHGGRGYNVGMAIDNFDVSGDVLPLALNSASPNRTTIGSSVTLTGAGFHATQDSGEVRFNDGVSGYVVASITSWSNASIVCTVPSGAESHSTEGVWVYQDSIDSDKLEFTIVLGAPDLDDLDQL